jgi:geranylgeranyl diphosphate synthase type II
MLNYDEQYNEYKAAIDGALDGYLPVTALPQKKLLDSMRYSLMSVGKRLRPVMLLEFCRMCGGDWRGALPFACALEMIHTYSLIHDDLPCMDNDDDRRGRATNHVIYGDTTALLAGSALLSAAFEASLAPPLTIPAERAIRAGYIIARASGLHGIAGGQALDLQPGGTDKVFINERKTAAMFIAAAEAGCVAADASEELIQAASKFGRIFGLAFQYADDHEDAGGKETVRTAAVNAYNEAKELLKPFGETPFLTEAIDRLTAKMEKGGG